MTALQVILLRILRPGPVRTFLVSAAALARLFFFPNAPYLLSILLDPSKNQPISFHRLHAW